MTVERFTDKRPAYVRRNFYLLCACLTILVFLAAGLVAMLFLGDRPSSGAGTQGVAERAEGTWPASS